MICVEMLFLVSKNDIRDLTIYAVFCLVLSDLKDRLLLFIGGN